MRNSSQPSASRTGLIVTGAMLGTTAALYATSIALHSASLSEVSGSPGGTYSLSESGAARVPRPFGVLFAPALSREMYGLHAAGRF